MVSLSLRDQVLNRILPRVRTPAQYVGGELHVVHKDHAKTPGKLCLAFPDTYTIGMSHHGLQVLYSRMNARSDWLCERVFTPLPDMEQALREAGLPLYSLESFTPLRDFDLLGFTLQYEISGSNLLTMLDLGGIPLHSEDRTMADPLVIAGGPCAHNPEPLAPFVDLFVTGDGEPSLPAICDFWLKLRGPSRAGNAQSRAEAIAEMAGALPYVYAPRFYEPEFADGQFTSYNRTTRSVPATIEPSVIDDLDAVPLPTKPIVPFVECVHDRVAIEIMRGCPWQCRFCQSTVIKRPLRFRSVDTIVEAALASYYATGYNELSILSLSTSDYPHFEQLVNRLRDVLLPLDVSISIPSLRVNETLKSVPKLIPPSKRSGLTLAPEVARDDMREQIRKNISNQDLFDGCREAFRQGFQHVKLYFLCGLPGERQVDLDGIIDMAETIAGIGREVRGKPTKVVASVSNFVPKAHTPYQWNGMQQADYFRWAHTYMRRKLRVRSVQLKCHDIETSLLEGVLSRGDRRLAQAIEIAWRNGARLDGWREHMQAELWWNAIAECGLQRDQLLHRAYQLTDRLPWDQLNVKKGRAY
ncbi:MAG: TIGR03960 family B12-binding radical SAM protein, partial [Planctomycetales bacterium]|nr:TIGR03960 family B12-binding radical SAM protein [Planctomycetales bacterium]